MTEPTAKHQEEARERLTDEQITQQVADMQARLSQCSSTGVAYRVKWRDVKAIIETIETLQERLAQANDFGNDIVEREAACCPEDVPFDEYVRRLESALSAYNTQIREVLEGLRFRHGCWCELPPNITSPDHTCECDAARELWERVQDTRY